MENDGTYRWHPDDLKDRKKMPSLKKLGKKSVLLLLLLLLIAGSMSCFYTVDDKQQAVVTTFGKVTDITDAGVHFKLPFGIQGTEGGCKCLPEDRAGLQLHRGKLSDQ